MEYSKKIVEKAKQKSLQKKSKSTPKATLSLKTTEAEKTVSEHSQDDQTKPATAV
jgi:hypothetical protein